VGCGGGGGYGLSEAEKKCADRRRQRERERRKRVVDMRRWVGGEGSAEKRTGGWGWREPRGAVLRRFKVGGYG
jgi:hypothetical protein